MIPGSCRQQYWLKFIMKRTLLMTAPKSLWVFGQDSTARTSSLATRTVGGGTSCTQRGLPMFVIRMPWSMFFHGTKTAVPSHVLAAAFKLDMWHIRRSVRNVYQVWYPSVPCCAAPCLLCCAVLCCAVLCCAVLYCAVSLWTIRSSLHCAGIAARCATVTMMGHLSELFGGVWCNVIEIFASHVHTCPPRNCSCAHLYHHSCCTSEHLDRFAGNTSEA